MPPRYMPDLCLIALFQQMSPNDQMSASKVNSRWLFLLRAANRRVRSLAIVCLSQDPFGEQVITFQDFIYNCFIGSNLSSQQLKNENGQRQYPKTFIVRKWNCLLFNKTIDVPTIELIVTIFSAVIDLKVTLVNTEHLKFLTTLLQHPKWSHQLSSFTLYVDSSLHSQNDCITDEQAEHFFTAINGLFALKHLALSWSIKTAFYNLSIISQLKEIAINFYNSDYQKSHMLIFSRSLELYASKNVDLQVQLYSPCMWDYYMECLLTLSAPTRDRIVQLSSLSNLSICFIYINVPHLLTQFTFLTSLNVAVGPRNYKKLFTVLSRLSHLVELGLSIYTIKTEDENQERDIIAEEFKFDLFSRPIAQLKTVKSLVLELRITLHSQVAWLNLQWTLPNLQCISIEVMHCENCKVHCETLSEKYLKNETFSKCFRSILTDLNPSVHSSQIYLYYYNFYCSVEQIFANQKFDQFHSLYPYHEWLFPKPSKDPELFVLKNI